MDVDGLNDSKNSSILLDILGVSSMELDLQVSRSCYPDGLEMSTCVGAHTLGVVMLRNWMTYWIS
jgi:hypothetical protein